MPTRHYFRKAIEPAPKPPKVRRPVHKGKNVLVEVTPGHWRTMSSAGYARLIGNSKGGLTTAARGKTTQWTSEQATKAIQKCWKTKWGKGSRIGVRLGRPAKPKRTVDRQALRAYYLNTPTKGIRYAPAVMGTVDSPHFWFSTNPDNTWQELSETQALRRLGHLAGLHKVIPTGRVIAVQKKPKAGWEIFCSHANEVPNICPCPQTCGCRYYHCKRCTILEETS